MTKTFTSYSEKETQDFADQLGQLLKCGDVVCLYGDLGAGKTCFIQGLGRGLGVKEKIKSPSFVLLHCYTTGRLPLYHWDLYRLEDFHQVEELGWEDYLEKEGINVVEWADRLGELPSSRLEVRISFLDDTTREIHVEEICNKD